MEVYTGLVSFSWNFFFQIANTLLLVFLLTKFLYKPVNKWLDKRKAQIADDVNGAAEARKEAETLKADYEKKIKEIRMEADAILKDARTKADDNSKKIIQEARDKSDDIIEKAQVEIERQERNAANELKNDVASMAVMAAEKIIGEKMDDELNEKLVVKFIEEAGDVKWQN